MSDSDARITTQQLVMADMGGRIQLEEDLRAKLTEVVKRDTSTPEKLDPVVQGAIQTAYPSETVVSAEMLFKSNVRGDIDLDSSLRSTLSRIIRDSTPAKASSMAKSQ